MEIYLLENGKVVSGPMTWAGLKAACEDEDYPNGKYIDVRVVDRRYRTVYDTRRNYLKTEPRLRMCIDDAFHSAEGIFQHYSMFMRRYEFVLNISTACTDGFMVFINPEFAEFLADINEERFNKEYQAKMKWCADNHHRMTQGELKSFAVAKSFRLFLWVLIHECFHQVYSHMERMHCRFGKNITKDILERCNIAMDMEINRDIQLWFPEFKGAVNEAGGYDDDKPELKRVWSQIYDELDSKPQETPPNNGGDGQPQNQDQNQDGEDSDDQSGESGSGNGQQKQMSAEEIEGWNQAMKDAEDGFVDPDTFDLWDLDSMDLSFMTVKELGNMLHMASIPKTGPYANKSAEWYKGYNNAIRQIREAMKGNYNQNQNSNSAGQSGVADVPDQFKAPNQNGGQGQQSQNQNGQNQNGQQGQNGTNDQFGNDSGQSGNDQGGDGQSVQDGDQNGQGGQNGNGQGGDEGDQNGQGHGGQGADEGEPGGGQGGQNGNGQGGQDNGNIEDGFGGQGQGQGGQNGNGQSGQNGNGRGQGQNGQGQGGNSGNGQGGQQGQGRDSGNGQGQQGQGQGKGQNGQGGTSGKGAGAGSGIRPGSMRPLTREIARRLKGDKVYSNDEVGWGSDLISREESRRIAKENGISTTDWPSDPRKSARENVRKFKNEIANLPDERYREMSGMLKIIEEELRSIIDWRAILEDLLRNAGLKPEKDEKISIAKMVVGREDAWVPSKEYIEEMYERNSADVFYLIDTSGSMIDEMGGIHARCFAEIIELETLPEMNIRKSALTFFAEGIRTDRIRMWKKEDDEDYKKSMISSYENGVDVGGGTQIAKSIRQVVNLENIGLDEFYTSDKPETLLIVYTDGDECGTWQELTTLPKYIRENMIFLIVNNKNRLQDKGNMLMSFGIPKDQIVLINSALYC